MKRGGRAGGFTLVELLVVFAILAILAGLAIPHLQRAIIKARAADAIADLDVVGVAAIQYHGEHQTWPPDVGRGTVPAGMEEFLPDGFSMVQEDWVLDWDNWSGRSTGFVGVTVITDEAELGEAMLALLGDAGTWTNGRDKFSWIIEWD